MTLRRAPAQPHGPPAALGRGAWQDESVVETSTFDILVVDDNSANLLAIEAALSGMGLNLVTAQSGPDALRWLLERDFALILLDIEMPNMDGYETARMIRARPRTRHVPIIFVTAFSRDEREVAFTMTTPAGTREVWLAAPDRSVPPRRVVQSADEVSFGADDDLVFRSLEDKVNFLMRIGKDGSGLRRVIETPILNKFGVSPNGLWTAVLAPGQGESTSYVTFAVPLRGGAPFSICNGCAVRDLCLDHALGRREHEGVWGGCTERERRRIIRRRRRAAA